MREPPCRQGGSTRRQMLWAAALAVALSLPFSANAQEDKSLRITVIVDGTRLTGTLEDNPSARDFYAILPLELSMEDYGGNEKISSLLRKLVGDGSEPFANPAIGDIASYAPWGNLIFYYKPYRFSKGVIRLGKLDQDVATLVRCQAK
jgi:hypothetical protein